MIDCIDQEYGGNGSLWHWWFKTHGRWKCERCGQTVVCKNVPPAHVRVETIRKLVKSGRKFSQRKKRKLHNI